MAGIPTSQVEVIEGSRTIPTLPAPRPGRDVGSVEELSGLSPEALFDRLAESPGFHRAFDEVIAGPVSLTRWCEAAGAADVAAGTALLRAAASAKKNSEPLLPLRIHAFHRVQPGAWACINPACPGTEGTALADASWGFGFVQIERVDRCPVCSAPMLEIRYCSVCELVSLSALAVPDNQGREKLTQMPEDDEEDDFFSPLEGLDARSAETDNDNNLALDDGVAIEGRAAPAPPPPQGSWPVLVTGTPRGPGAYQFMEPATGLVLDREEPGSARVRIHSGQFVCPHCRTGFTGDAKLLSIRVGAPFLLGSVVPELLDDASAAPRPIRKGKEDARARPADGHVLLMFTDSRQGTARLSAKLQRDAEQNHVRSFIYHKVQASQGGRHEEERQRLKDEVEDLRKVAEAMPKLKQLLASREQALAELDQPKPIVWQAMIEAISQDDRINRFIRENVWQEREASFSNSTFFARFLLFREFLRQPTRGNSAETMGLAACRSKLSKHCTKAKCPAFSRTAGER